MHGTSLPLFHSWVGVPVYLLFMIHVKRLDNQLISMNAICSLHFSMHNIACATAVSISCYCLFMTSIACITFTD